MEGDSRTQFDSRVSPQEGERVLTKHDVSAFAGTSLEQILLNNQTALKHLGKAISLDATYRTQAQQDKDLEGIQHMQEFKMLLK
ncbi:hypothetical protein COW36_10635 [bacterium (Candidatus Blackallbacteria) CG17_big_fil_post_rev_8_21_14_2_50_48_46]|uniref:Uncharacterized protein n=1 Tax=bacterium (Candidatus Blackallbacteria) CG17_big_fil_post_rev_8_21_14_2_50_48_46 TaxID=2014261 RepID=A0A2M7G4R9_9BACT|nr:MAG: hypothetical protein COW64_20685 [bacterium (Candidatus Blackallbacteria) CG18_big_fil_WC_8_21_14_2_50_49_26]PIW16924.1 MAG: hypothetical protein COW36_10635 [bacterium (Candidatus Blackallbacteria) CG17_big_fil_post_rev_8_21_14_2_50_48_46]PIW50202.1 MAG: hypothetical protein COW20_03145 [bacterium (Candidatus Blackallbacteria) CG13_big_fil_rev_8_21_14_2_50_49_14]